MSNIKYGQRIEMEDEKHTRNVVCPYCKHEEVYDTADGLPDGEFSECGKCGHDYIIYSDVTIDYSTYPLAYIRIAKGTKYLNVGEIVPTTSESSAGETCHIFINGEWTEYKGFKMENYSIPVENAEWLGYINPEDN